MSMIKKSVQTEGLMSQLIAHIVSFDIIQWHTGRGVRKSFKNWRVSITLYYFKQTFELGRI